MELPEVYRTGAAAFMTIASDLTDDQLGTRVPACPEWSVHDLLAHQAGSSADLARGDVDGVATPAWTARQVDARRTRRVDELVAEWSLHVDAVSSLCAVATPSPAWDVTAHLDDLREAIGLPVAPSGQGRDDCLAAALAFLRDRTGVRVSVAEREADPGTTTWHVATAYGLWRALFSRLDRAALEKEVLRGEVDAFRQVAFFAA